MKIERISAYVVELPKTKESFKFGRKEASYLQSTIVKIDTDAGITGYGEVCPLGSNYLPAFSAGALAGVAELSRSLIGLNPCEVNRMNEIMDYNLIDHPYVKAPIDMACWDILGKQCQLPLCTLLGGRYGEDFDVYTILEEDSPKEMRRLAEQSRKNGYRNFQIKLGSGSLTDIERILAIRESLQPDDVVFTDANGAWSLPQALRICKYLADQDVYLEQPCESIENCAVVRQHTHLPILLDECVDTIETLQGIINRKLADIVVLKLSKQGGITKTKLARDLCVANGITVRTEDSCGLDLMKSAVAHVTHSTPERLRFAQGDMEYYTANGVIGTGAPAVRDGRVRASESYGLGIQVDENLLGNPIMII